MNKQTNLDQIDRPSRSLKIVEKFTVENFKDELQKRSRQELDLCLKKLNFLCLEFDPYQCDHLKIEEENILKEFDLIETIKNPFEFTKIILQMLDNLETELKNRSH